MADESVVPADPLLVKSADPATVDVQETVDAPLGDPVSATGLQIGDQMQKSGGPNFYDENGRLVPEKLPLWLAAVTSSGVVVGFLKMDPEWETLPGDEARKRLNPWSNIWNQEGTMLIGCLTADGPVFFDGKAFPCD